MSLSLCKYYSLVGTVLVQFAVGNPLSFEAETNEAYVPYVCVALNGLTEHLTRDSHITIFCDDSVKDDSKRLIEAALVQDKGYQHRLEFRSVEETLQDLPEDFQPIWTNINTIMNDDGLKLFIALRALFPVLFAEEEHTTHLDMDMIIQEDLKPILLESFKLPQPVVSALLGASPALFGRNEHFKQLNNTSVSGGFVTFNWEVWRQVLGTHFHQQDGDLRTLALRWLSEVFAHVRRDGPRFVAYWEIKPQEILTIHTEEMLFNSLLEAHKNQAGKGQKIIYMSTVFNAKTDSQLQARMMLESRQSLSEGQKKALQQVLSGSIPVWHYDHESKPLTKSVVKPGTPDEKFFQTVEHLLKTLPQEENQTLRRIIRQVAQPFTYAAQLIEKVQPEVTQPQSQTS